MVTRYRFTTLWVQESLSQDAPMPFGVIVETKRYVYYLGYQLTGDESTIKGRALVNFPDVLKQQILSAEQRSHSKRHLLDKVVKTFSWNVFAAKLSSGFAWRKTVEQIGDRLFQAHVVGHGEAAPTVRTRKAVMIRLDLNEALAA